MFSPSFQDIKRDSEVLSQVKLSTFHDPNAYPERHPSHGAFRVRDKSLQADRRVTLAISSLILEGKVREKRRWQILTGKQFTTRNWRIIKLQNTTTAMLFKLGPQTNISIIWEPAGKANSQALPQICRIWGWGPRVKFNKPSRWFLSTTSRMRSSGGR